jgi:hypothetical protein
MKKLILGLCLLCNPAFVLADETRSTNTDKPAARSEADGAKPSLGSEGQESVCKSGEKVRRVQLDMATKSCLVKYYKDTENPGVEKQLWKYDVQHDVCKEKYSGFVDGLKKDGWP